MREMLLQPPWGGEKLAGAWNGYELEEKELFRLTMCALPYDVLEPALGDLDAVHALCDMWRDAGVHLGGCAYLSSRFLCRQDRDGLLERMDRRGAHCMWESRAALNELEYRMAIPLLQDAGFDCMLGAWASGVPYEIALNLGA